MQSRSPAVQRVANLAAEMIEALRDNRIDEAEQMLEELDHLVPGGMQEFLVFPVLIAIQRGRVNEALQYLNQLGEDEVPELKALCLRLLGDPSWHYHAQRGLQSEDPSVRKAMTQMLELDSEEKLIAAVLNQ